MNNNNINNNSINNNQNNNTNNINNTNINPNNYNNQVNNINQNINNTMNNNTINSNTINNNIPNSNNNTNINNNINNTNTNINNSINNNTNINNEIEELKPRTLQEEKKSEIRMVLPSDIKEKPKKPKPTDEELNYKPLSKFKTILLILFFVSLIAFVFFLPDISFMVSEFMNNQNKEEIKTGILKCSKERQSETMDYTYLYEMSFENEKLKNMTYTKTVRGDRNLDESNLDKENEDCIILKENVREIDSVVVSCDYDNTMLINKQKFKTLNIKEEEKEKISAAYIEAGGTIPDFKNNQQIKIIEAQMKDSGYECERIKS